MRLDSVNQVFALFIWLKLDFREPRRLPPTTYGVQPPDSSREMSPEHAKVLP